VILTLLLSLTLAFSLCVAVREVVVGVSLLDPGFEVPVTHKHLNPPQGRAARDRSPPALACSRSAQVFLADHEAVARSHTPEERNSLRAN
jgi:hypothetical protein